MKTEDMLKIYYEDYAHFMKLFMCVCTDTNDAESLVCPNDFTTQEIFHKTLNNCQAKVREIAMVMNISDERVFHK